MYLAMRRLIVHGMMQNGEAGIMEDDLSNDAGAVYENRVESKIKEDRLPPGHTRIDDRRCILRYSITLKAIAVQRLR